MTDLQLAFRKRLLYIPLALHLSLSGCSLAPAGTAPDPAGIRTVQSAFGGTRQLTAASPDQGTHDLNVTVKSLQHLLLVTTLHRWTSDDVVKYVVRLRYKENGNYHDFDPEMVLTLDQKVDHPANLARFTGLLAGKTYQVSVEAWGNKGANTEDESQRLDGNSPSSQDVTFTEDDNHNLEDTQDISFTPILDNTAVAADVAVKIEAPIPGSLVTVTSITSSYTLETSTLTSSVSTIVPEVTHTEPGELSCEGTGPEQVCVDGSSITITDTTASLSLVTYYSTFITTLMTVSISTLTATA